MQTDNFPAVVEKRGRSAVLLFLPGAIPNTTLLPGFPPLLGLSLKPISLRNPDFHCVCSIAKQQLRQQPRPFHSNSPTQQLNSPLRDNLHSERLEINRPTTVRSNFTALWKTRAAYQSTNDTL